jgi:hypothetical protein
MKPNIGLLGANGVGKTTIADYLVAEHGYRKLSFAEPLRELARLNYDWRQAEETLGYNEAKNGTVAGPWFRQYLIDLGEGIRKYDPVYFVKALASQITDMDPDKPWVVDDVRKQVEVNFLGDMGFRFLEITDGVPWRTDLALPTRSLIINNDKGGLWMTKVRLTNLLRRAEWALGTPPSEEAEDAGASSPPVLERQGAGQDGEGVPAVGEGAGTPHWCARCEREAAERGYPRAGGDASEGGRGGDEGPGLGDAPAVRDGEGKSVRCHSPRCGGVVLNPSHWPGDVRPDRK